MQLQFAGYKESTVNLCPTPCQTFSRVLGAERSSWICKGRSWKTRNCRDELYFLCLPQLNEPARISSAPMCSSAKWYTHNVSETILLSHMVFHLHISSLCWSFRILFKLRRVARLLACQRSSAEEAWGFVRNCSEKKRIEFTLRWKHWEDLGSVAKRCMGYYLVTVFFLGLILIEELWRSFRSVGHGSLQFSHFHHAAGSTIWLSQKLVFELFWCPTCLSTFVYILHPTITTRLYVCFIYVHLYLVFV